MIRHLLERLHIVNPPPPVIKVANNTFLHFRHHRVHETVVIEVAPEKETNDINSLYPKLFGR